MPDYLCNFEPSIKYNKKMATLLQYKNGLVVPVQQSKISVMEKMQASVSPSEKSAAAKFFKLFVVITVALNTLLTIVAVAS